jgi:predicted  nucleic acid-binding Zn-ribbon protein
MAGDQNNSWNEYSKLVLKELETLAVGISNLSTEIQDVKREIALIKDREDKVDKLQDWKDKISEVVSPSQLSELTKEVKELKDFKTRAITIFVVVQTIMGMVMAVLNYMK